MRDVFIEIWGSVSRNKLRTCLTGFAVAWGIFMLIVLLGAGQGVFNAFLMSSDDVAFNTMTVYGNFTTKAYDGLEAGRLIRLDDRDTRLTESALFADYVDEIAPTVTQSGFKMTYGKRYFDVSLQGVYPRYDRMNAVQMLAGRFINYNDIKEQRKVVILPHMQAKNFLGGRTDYESLVGKHVRIGNLSYKIIGVRQGAENEDDSNIYTPYTTLKTIFGRDDKLDWLEFTFHGLETEEDNEAFEKNYRAVINRAHRAAPDDEGAIYISNRFTQSMQMNEATGILKTGLWIVGLFTLLSGIVGISNIMLITVKERTHEFGIRKAIGAKPWDIMKLILAESVSITAVFGYIGMFLGMVACMYLDAKYGHSTMDVFGYKLSIMKNPTVGLDVALEATLVMIIAGVIAGMIPARKAIRIKPVEALRAD